MKSETPLICNMNVFTPAEREAHIQTTTELIQSIQSTREVKNGYAFVFPNESALIVKIAEFITNERLCCPFLEFTLAVSSNAAPVAFALTGPEGTRKFLQAEFEGAFG